MTSKPDAKAKQKQQTEANQNSKTAINDIFSQLGSSKSKEKNIEQSATVSNKTVSKLQKKAEKRPRDEAPKKDGLYHAPKEELDMSDDMFFSRDGGKNIRRTADGLRLMTEEEIVKATNAGSKKAGTTPNCPFDCDCCF